MTCPGAEPVLIRHGVDGIDGIDGKAAIEVGGHGYTVLSGTDPVLIRHGVDGVDGESCTAEAGGLGHT